VQQQRGPCEDDLTYENKKGKNCTMIFLNLEQKKIHKKCSPTRKRKNEDNVFDHTMPTLFNLCPSICKMEQCKCMDRLENDTMKVKTMNDDDGNSSGGKKSFQKFNCDEIKTQNLCDKQDKHGNKLIDLCPIACNGTCLLSSSPILSSSIII